MDQKQEQSGKADNLSRRKFIRNGATAAAGLAAGLGAAGCESMQFGKAEKPRSYNPEMEYRPLGKTGLSISAVCMGGHWKRVDKMVPGVFKDRSWLSADIESDGFKKNRRDVVSRCIEHGINYVDACTWQEVAAYSEALRGRRDAMYLGFSWYQEEMRSLSSQWHEARKKGKPKPAGWITERLMAALDKGMKKVKLDYVDVWRITMHEQSGRHTEVEVDEMMGALEKARKQGKVRFTGFSSHDRKHIKWMIETYPEVVQVVVTPYTAKSKVLEKESLFDTLQEYGVGFFGIKPFASNSLFKGDSSPDSPTADQDNRLARMAIRYILCNPAITAPIPGMINPQQVDNVVKAVKERRQLDLAEAKELEEAMDQAWANLPSDYQWLKNWEYV
ncbi:MAG: aldo/keto reductase [Planctomycetes bacterium]|nr:aldo/keto reductase [Planctomycetota bacterium]